ncbi:MAG TPA: glycosyltransferase family A protein [Rhizobiaceae bacterium]
MSRRHLVAASRIIESSPRDCVVHSQVRFPRCGSEMAPDVAVVIPYYNGSKFIRRSVESVLAQTIRPAEFVVVNDGSEADEAAFLHKLAVELNFTVIDKDNGGQGSARNAGVAATRAPFICLLDQDDIFLPEHIEILRRAVAADARFGWVYGDLIEADGDGNVVRTSMLSEHGRGHPKRSIFDMLSSDMFVLPSASMISRKAFESVGGFDEQFTGYEDDDLFLRMFRAGFTNSFVASPVTVWCINTDSTSFSMRMSRSRLRYFKKLVSSMPNEPLRNRYYLRDCLVPRFRRNILGEAFLAVARAHTPRGTMLAPHRDELIQMAKEFCSIVVADDYVSPKQKRHLRMQAAIVSSGSRLMCEAALFLSRKMGRSPL